MRTRLLISTQIKLLIAQGRSGPGIHFNLYQTAHGSGDINEDYNENLTAHFNSYQTAHCSCSGDIKENYWSIPDLFQVIPIYSNSKFTGEKPTKVDHAMKIGVLNIPAPVSVNKSFPPLDNQKSMAQLNCQAKVQVRN